MAISPFTKPQAISFSERFIWQIPDSLTTFDWDESVAMPDRNVDFITRPFSVPPKSTRDSAVATEITTADAVK
jgi:hypothetical protein